MRVATINISGNVGKTTIAKNLLYPRIPGAELFEIESMNTGIKLKSASIKSMRSSSYGSLVDSIMVTDSAIIDIGASNIEGVLKEMQELDGSHEDFDCFLIPLVKDRKIIEESVKTALLLAGLGVPTEKIKMVFNRFPKDADLHETYGQIFKLANDGKFSASKDAVIYENPVYAELNKLEISLHELNCDTTDYRVKLKDAKNDKEQKLCLAMIANKRRAISATQNLDDVFAALFNKG
ncbi:StbB family protein [Massilia sp. CCM 9210]|uniref:StbB family protein n=1 Tax=Massilia scottii TaxID=3057166 RepID=UPI00279649D9|nr:StbB family protein [Massilia sp. CCM 9210]MDQ1817800.1 StbB family protein [Massilia sp. CCM 9210]